MCVSAGKSMLPYRNFTFSLLSTNDSINEFTITPNKYTIGLIVLEKPKANTIFSDKFTNVVCRLK